MKTLYESILSSTKTGTFVDIREDVAKVLVELFGKPGTYAMLPHLYTWKKPIPDESRDWKDFIKYVKTTCKPLEKLFKKYNYRTKWEQDQKYFSVHFNVYEKEKNTYSFIVLTFKKKSYYDVNTDVYHYLDINLDFSGDWKENNIQDYL